MKGKSSRFIIICLALLVLAISLGFVREKLKIIPFSGTNSRNKPFSYVSGEKPNVILITIDTLRADHVQCYGYSKNTSPNIDQLAEEGSLFLNTICQATTTPVSHASILTGLYPYHHGLRYLHGGNNYKLKDTITTLAEMLKEDGYKTAAFISAFPLISERYNLSQGFEYYDEDFIIDEYTMNCPLCRQKGLINTGKSQRRSDETNRKVFEWLENHYGERFFIWVHYFDPHDPIVIPPEEFLQKFPPIQNKRSNTIEMYDVEIAYTDYQFGELWKKIKELGIDEKSLFILTSDHGEGLNDHGYWSHAEKLYQEQVHVPMIIRYSKLFRGKKISAITRTVDIVPTIMDVLYLPLSESRFDGISMLPHITGNQPVADLMAYNETHYPKFLDNASPLFSVIDQKWKFVYYPEKEEMNQLFDLKNDPVENKNVVVKHPKLVQKFKNYLKRENVFNRDDSVPKPKSMEEDVLEKLRSLGYLNGPDGVDQ